MIPSDERYTPEHILDRVREIAPIALDPCTTRDNRTKAAAFFALPDDGLTAAWPETGLVWINPPYSRGQLYAWASRARSHAAKNAAAEIVMLTPSDLGTSWGRVLASSAQAAAFLFGRLAFIAPEGPIDTGAKQPSVVWYFGDRKRTFRRAFHAIATVASMSP